MGLVSRWLAIWLLLFSGGARAAEAPTRQTIRVGLYYGDTAPRSVQVAGRLHYQAETSSGDLQKPTVLAADGETIVLDAARVGRWIELSPAPGAPPLQLNGAAYRGELRVDLQSNATLRVVNTVELEDYLRGVVPNEMFADDEAYRVQAIIVRTYGLYVRDQEKKHHPDGFDICTTGHCQVYRGLDSETPRSDEAVAATKGLVLTRGGRIIFSAYHTNAGGETVEVDEAWPGSLREAFRYLPRVASPYDVEARRLPGFEWCYEWRRTVNPGTLVARLGAKAADLGALQKLEVVRRNRAGRVATLRIVGARGRLVIVGPPAIQAAFEAPSARFEILHSPEGFVLHGWGCGDGVGLSQHGALGMARAGYSYESILAHYYRGVELSEGYGAGKSRPLRAGGGRTKRGTAPDRGRS